MRRPLLAIDGPPAEGRPPAGADAASRWRRARASPAQPLSPSARVALALALCTVVGAAAAAACARGPPGAVPASNVRARAAKAAALLDPASTAEGRCEKFTGGTCFWNECDAAYRGGDVHCNTTALLWRACMCGASSCAHIDGRCREDADPGMGASKLLRHEDMAILLFLFVPLGRSAFLNLLARCLGVDKASAVTEMKTTHFGFARSWRELRDELGFSYPWQPMFTSLFKLVLLHLVQVIFVLLGILALKPMMGPIQCALAVVVAMKEIWYFALIVWGTFKAPRFLLLVPLSDANKRLVWTFFCCPEYFITCCLSASSTTLPGVRNDLLDANTSLRRRTYYVSSLGGFAACAAILVGCVGDGAMSCSLLLGYMMSSCSVAVVLLARLEDPATAMRAAIPAAVETMRGGSPAERAAAARLLCNLAVDSEERRAQMQAVIPAAVEMVMRAEGGPEREAAADLLHNLAVDSEERRAQMQAVIPAAVEMVRRAEGGPEREAAARLLCRLAAGSEERSAQMQAVIPAAVEMVRRAEGGPEREAAAALLWRLAFGSEERRAQMQAVIPAAVEMVMRAEGGPERVAAARLLCRLAFGSEERSAQMQAVIPAAVEMVRRAEGGPEKVAAAGLLYCLAFLSEERSAQMQAVIPAAVEMVRRAGGAPEREAAAALLWRLAFGSEERSAQMQAVIPAAVEMASGGSIAERAAADRLLRLLGHRAR